ncbi:MAG: YqaJ viral recombinase family protein [Elusimicrobia bacterium]|nr:YqaJ viral recombinase family protein [Elusimicrobiota bacterium]
MIQGTDEWLAIRAGRFTGSRFADLMATTRSGPSASRGNLITTVALERLTGEPEQTYQNDAMRRGSEMEPLARGAYEAETGELVACVAFIIHPAHDFCGVSPDGLVGDDGLIEIKCPASQAKHLAALRTGAHAQEYQWQIQGQLWVTGRRWCDAVSYDPRFPEGLQLAVKRVERDEKAIATLAEACITANEEVEAIVAELRGMKAAA